MSGKIVLLIVKIILLIVKTILLIVKTILRIVMLETGYAERSRKSQRKSQRKCQEKVHVYEPMSGQDTTFRFQQRFGCGSAEAKRA